MGWQETPKGRVRLWCLYCQRDGRTWETPELCEHILHAKTEDVVTEELGKEYRQSLLNQFQRDQQALQASPQPASLPPEPSGAPRPLYNEATYTRRSNTPPSEETPS